jgi:hypothetical protein
MPISNWSRYLRFSLASLLLVVTAVGVFLAPIVNRVRHQQRVIASVENLGGQVHFVHEAKKRAGDLGWLRKWLGEDYFRTVRYINLQGHAATDDLVAGIVALGDMQELNLGKTKITNDSLRHIAKLKDLKALDIGFNKITNDGLVHLGPLEELVHLDLDVTEITDQGLSALQKLPKLNRLQLFHTHITDAGAETLSRFPALSELDVADTLITNDGVAHLAKLKLTWLRLDQCSAGEGRELRINDAGLEHVARMTNLREVSLIQLNVTDEGFQRLKQTRPVLAVHR